jgi:hypothetical protein
VKSVEERRGAVEFERMIAVDERCINGVHASRLRVSGGGRKEKEIPIRKMQVFVRDGITPEVRLVNQSGASASVNIRNIDTRNAITVGRREHGTQGRELSLSAVLPVVDEQRREVFAVGDQPIGKCG